MRESIFRILKVTSLFLFIAGIVLGCNEIFEEDLSDDIVTLTIPADGTITPVQSTQFRWSEVAGATSYNLEVVSPTFFGLTSYIYDTTVTDSEVTLTLYPGDYEWRVRGENFGSSTAYSEIFSLKIDTTSDLSVQTITLTAPLNSATNANTVDFSWTALSAADSYQLQVYSGATFGSGTLLLDTNLTSTSVTGYSVAEGEFTWGVKAINSVPSETAYSSSYFEVDRSAPQDVTLAYPDGDNFTTDSNYTYTWTSLADTGAYQTSLIDSIYIATDSLFTSIYKRFGTSLGAQSDMIPLPDTYYWRIKTYDRAGNSSSYSGFKSFEVQ